MGLSQWDRTYQTFCYTRITAEMALPIAEQQDKFELVF